MLGVRGLVEGLCAGLQSAGSRVRAGPSRPQRLRLCIGQLRPDVAARTWPVRRDRLQLTLSAGRPRSCWGRGTGGQPLPQVRGQPIGVQDVDPVQRAAVSVDPSPLRACLTREGASFRPPPSRPQRGDPGGFGDWRKRSHSNPAGGGAVCFLVPSRRRKGGSGASLATVSAGFSARAR